MDSPPLFVCPITCMAGIGEVWNGSYEHGGIHWGSPPIVLDIGANCGAFAIRAALNWKSPKVICFEPIPETFKYLHANLSIYGQFELFNAAVGNPAHDTMTVGNTPLLSFQDYGPPTSLSVKVNVIEPERLPFANAIKIDTEGAEGYICEHLPYVPDYLAVECHSDPLRMQVMNSLNGKMQLLECKVNALGISILKFIKPQ